MFQYWYFVKIDVSFIDVYWDFVIVDLFIHNYWEFIIDVSMFQLLIIIEISLLTIHLFIVPYWLFIFENMWTYTNF